MTKSKYILSLFIFRRDLRLHDNTALNEALNLSTQVIPCFIIDPRQANPHSYRSSFAMRFLGESLESLQEQLRQHKARLFLFSGCAEDIVEQLLEKLPIKAVFVNRDYTPFSVKRDLALKKNCDKKGVVFHSLGDLLLHEPPEVYKEAGGPYTVFTPFYRKSQTLEVRPARSLSKGSFYTQSISSIPEGDLSIFLNDQNPQSLIQGGLQAAKQILDNLAHFKDYDQTRNIPSIAGTTRLSTVHKFGVVSIREVYHRAVKCLGSNHTFISELFWRDFFSHVAHHFPHVFGHSFYEQYDKIPWEKDEVKFKAWCQGETGFPIVDAGMRELNQTGFMHNRVRMITASFLVKDLHIDWRRGEQYFASKLVDYDPAVNNGNWQWAASTGCDHQPYFRIFNPWLQQEKFDADSRYIKRWILELKSINPTDIHRWYQKSVKLNNYPWPIIDHKIEAQKAKAIFKKFSLESS